MYHLYPREEFYKLFAPDQVLDIARNLEIYKEIPMEYSYFGKGAGLWDAYATRLYYDRAPNAINTTASLISDNMPYLNFLLSDFDKINVIDITVGNGLPVKDLIARLLKDKKIHRYVAIDKSADMLQIISKNFNAWFGDGVNFEATIKDINYERFRDITSKRLARSSRDINLVLYLGGTSHNFRDMRDSFRTIHESMCAEDLLIHTLKLDTSNSRKYFDFSPEPSVSKLPPRHGLVLDLMEITSLKLVGVSDGLYEVERDYDEELGQRYIRVRLLYDIVIHFKIGNDTHHVHLKKGEAIQLLRMWHQNYRDVLDLLDSTGFKTLHFSHTDNQEYLLTISRIKRD